MVAPLAVNSEDLQFQVESKPLVEEGDEDDLLDQCLCARIQLLLVSWNGPGNWMSPVKSGFFPRRCPSSVKKVSVEGVRHRRRKPMKTFLLVMKSTKMLIAPPLKIAGSR